MARQQAPAKKATVYRLSRPGDEPLELCIQRKYAENEDDFQMRDVSIGGTESLLITGKISTDEPRWMPHLVSLVGHNPRLKNLTSAAALIVPLQEYDYALTWGFGHILLNPLFLDNGFGLRFAIRKASPDQVRSLTSHTMDTLARTARTSVPSGASLDAFGVEEIGEVISRLVGRISVSGLTAAAGKADSYATVRGADGLSLPLAKSPQNLLVDLRYLHDTVENEPPAKGLEHFEHTRPLRPGAPEINQLQRLLSQALEPGSPLIALTWPAEWQEGDHGEADSYKIRGAGAGREEQPDELELHHLLQPLAHREASTRFDALKRITVQGLNSDGFSISRAIHGDKWITFQIDHEGKRYVFHQGRWFDIGGAYLDLLRQKVEKILAKRSNLLVSDWPREVKPKGNIGVATEGRYNLLVQHDDPSFLRLDTKLLYTMQHTKGFEVCDLLGPDDELIHVKRMDGSVSASHLFNQALVAVEALRRQPDTVSKMQEVVRRESKGKRDIPDDFQPTKVVLAFGGRPATPEALFTFSQVTLARCAQRLAELEVELEILEIKDTPKILKEDLSLE
ncbi:TIGR04141 family sporadically distributed protein [Streptomyces thermocarboxydus]|uniref:DUF6119 family protein n=1 Tax=Streptomyces thermocarboxydus TaxID=59299 RepID=UPI0025C960E9|nr:TIGR04141 family sporadically distributed protein [Streptomyces thermocarboxydus]